MTSTLIVQIASLILGISALGLFVYAAINGYTTWAILLMPILLFINLNLFLFQRITIKLGVTLPIHLSGVQINSWAVSLQFQLALSTVVAIIVVIMSKRHNGR